LNLKDLINFKNLGKIWKNTGLVTNIESLNFLNCFELIQLSNFITMDQEKGKNASYFVSNPVPGTYNRHIFVYKKVNFILQ